MNEKEIKRQNLLDKIEDIYNAIAEEAGMNMSYNESINGSVYPSVIRVAMGETDEHLFDDLKFLAENEHIIPKEFKDATKEELIDYVMHHEDPILNEIESNAESDFQFRVGDYGELSEIKKHLSDIENMMLSIGCLKLQKPLKYFVTELCDEDLEGGVCSSMKHIDSISIDDVHWDSSEFTEPTLCANDSETHKSWIMFNHTAPDYKDGKGNYNTIAQIYKEVLSAWKKQFNHIIESSYFKNA